MDAINLESSHKLVHLDLKRAPLKLSYLHKLFPLFHSWGATGVLIEWEDTFPYSGELSAIGSLNTHCHAYSDEEVERIHQLAEQNCLMVIPLVQTFGHLEFVLKHAEWMELREINRYPSSLCPNHSRSLPLVKKMIDQVVAKLPKSSKYFHIGADEVWHHGMCSVCSEQDRSILLLNHIVAVLTYVKEHYPHLRCIMWDDMLRLIDVKMLQEYGIGELVDPMIWIYEPAPTFHLPEDLWKKYCDTFENVWVASAYKGATGSCQLLPVIHHHVSNHDQWISALKNKSGLNLLGIALTGWSRYDHYATLCELMPCGLPSLALCLRVWEEQGYTKEIYDKVQQVLGYTSATPLLLNPYPRPQPVAKELKFPGWEIAVGVEWLANLKGKHSAVVESDVAHTWMNPWHLKHNFTNPMHLQGLANFAFELTKEWDSFEIYMTRHMADAYYDPVIDEWLYTQVHNSKLAAKSMHKNIERQLSDANVLSPHGSPTPVVHLSPNSSRIPSINTDWKPVNNSSKKNNIT